MATLEAGFSLNLQLVILNTWTVVHNASELTTRTRPPKEERYATHTGQYEYVAGMRYWNGREYHSG